MHRYVVQLIPITGTPVEHPPFQAATRQEALLRWFEEVAEELADTSSTVGSVILYEDTQNIATVRIHG
jgi:hypothetical protein